jgi:hypothetical protein
MANEYPLSAAQIIQASLIGNPGPLRLVSDRPKGGDFESLDRRVVVGPRYRLRALAPWKKKSRPHR